GARPYVAGVPGGVLDQRGGGRGGADRPGGGGVPDARRGAGARRDAGSAVVDDGAVRRRGGAGRARLGAYRGDTRRALDDIKGWLAEDKAVVLISEGPGPAERMVELLKGVDVPARLRPSIDKAPDPKVVHVTTGLLEQGFV